MLSLSKAKVLGDVPEVVEEVQEFTYRGIEVHKPNAPAGSKPLPSNAEMLWNEPPVQELPPESSKKYTDEDVNVREQTAWEKGFQEATVRARENLKKALADEHEKMATALTEFAKEREDYFRNVERETVRLVLAVARKVLHREAQVDPLLLTGVVRVALENISNGTRLHLRVPADQTDDWRVLLRSLENRDSTVEIIADKSLEGPQCLIVTEAGTTDVSLEGQLAEIERGFLDLLAQRPGEPAPSELCASSYTV